MAVSADDLNAVRAMWGEWAAGSGFALGLEVCSERFPAEMVSEPGVLGARLASVMSVRVTVRRESDGALAFDQWIPCEPAALRASVAVLARTIASSAPLPEAL